MKIICGERTLDLDRMNSVKPDGEHVWSEIQPFTYSPENLPDSDAGTYLLTTDNGAVSIRDMAFKILFDLGVWSGAKCCRYLAREIARSVAADPERGWSTGLLPDAGAAGELRDSLGLLGVHMPPCGRLVRRNLMALSSPGCDLDAAVFGMLSDYVYTDGRSFQDIHDALSELLSSMPSDGLADFIEGVYGVLTCDPDDVRGHMAQDVPDAGQHGPDGPEGGAAAGTEPGGDPVTVPGNAAEENTEPGPGSMDGPDAGTEEAQPEDGVDAPDLHDLTVLERLSRSSVKDMPKGIKPLGIFSSGRRLKGSDLTGTDETFTLDYYAGFYREAMEKADSQGFADELIRSRAGFGTAPIAILQEAVSKLRNAVDANAGRGQGGNLESELMEMASIIRAAAGKIEALPEPPEPSGKAAGTNHPEQAPAPEPAADAVPPEQPAEAPGSTEREPDAIPDPDDMDGFGENASKDGQAEQPGQQDGVPEVPDEDEGTGVSPAGADDPVPGVPDEDPEDSGSADDGVPDYGDYDEYGDGDDGDDRYGERPEEDFDEEGDDGEP